MPLAPPAKRLLRELVPGRALVGGGQVASDGVAPAADGYWLGDGTRAGVRVGVRGQFLVP
jgi:hypothetical protein